MFFINKKNYYFCFLSLLFFYSINASICPIEKVYVGERERLIQATFPNTNRMGICLSGGSNRSVISCFGFLKKAKEIGLLDKCLYLASLSGTTWLMIYILSHLNINSDPRTIQDLQERLRINLSREFVDWDVLRPALGNRIVEIWGALTANQLFGPEAELLGQRFSSILPQNPATWPFPIFNAAVKIINDNCFFCCFCNCCCYKDEIVEANPCCIGTNTCISTNEFEQSLNRTFNQNHTLDFFIGLFGTAYNFSFGDLKSLIGMASQKRPFNLNPNAEYILSLLNSGTFLPTLVPNFDTSLSKAKFLTVRDAGFISNLPLISLLKRNLKKIFICDASENAPTLNYPELQKSLDQAKKINFPFPDISHPEILRKSNPNGPEFLMYIFRGPTTLVYFPNRIEFPSKKFQYAPPESDSVKNYMENCVQAFAIEINQLINE